MSDPLRPRRLVEFVGQRRVVARLAVAVRGALRRKEALGHALFTGPPGLGKTTLAAVAAAEMGAPFVAASGPALRRLDDLNALLVPARPRTVLFVDEVHRLPTQLEESLYTAMEDRTLYTSMAAGRGQRVQVAVELPPWTLVGATTRPGLLSKPLRGRFALSYHLEYYAERDLARIVERSAKALGLDMSPRAWLEVAKRARGTPRVANALLARVRDYAREGRQVSLGDAKRALDAEGVDPLGLNDLDYRYLRALVDTYSGGPAGAGAIGAAIGEDAETLEEVVEPYLVMRGLVARTPRGRVATPAGRALVGGSRGGE